MIERINWKCVMICGVLLFALYSVACQARDDGRYSNSPYKGWFDSQSNGQGTSCCHEGDAHRYDGHYTLNPDGSVTVMLDGKPHVLSESDRFGNLVVQGVGQRHADGLLLRAGHIELIYLVGYFGKERV